MPTKFYIMKKINLLIVSIALIFSSCTDTASYKTPETEMEKVSYSLGVNMASSVKQQGMETIEAQAVAKAFTDVFEGNDLDISEEESMTILQDFFGKKIHLELYVKVSKNWRSNTQQLKRFGYHN